MTTRSPAHSAEVRERDARWVEWEARATATDQRLRRRAIITTTLAVAVILLTAFFFL
jgi:hypothetical protein